MGEDSNSRGGVKWSKSRHALRTESTGLPDGLDLGDEKMITVTGKF